MIKVLALFWLADVVEKLGHAIVISWMFFIFGGLLLMLAWELYEDSLTGANKKEEVIHSKAMKKGVKQIGKTVGVVLIVFSALSILLPTKTTIYVAAGAVAGKTTLDSAIGQKTLEAIDLKLSDFIEKTKEGR